MRHTARLDRVGEDGVPLWAHLEARAPRSASARAALEGPECPVELGYLLGWAADLVGHSGASMDGLAPLSYPTVAAWAALCGEQPAPHEVDALMRIDAAMRHPDELAAPAPPAPAAWPQKKAG